jgi:hypothetical protein
MAATFIPIKRGLRWRIAYRRMVVRLAEERAAYEREQRCLYCGGPRHILRVWDVR